MRVDVPVTCPHCESKNLNQSEEVLDTWFSSALWPFSTMGWPDKTALLQTFYPTSVLVTGWDILFFWVARMTMFGMQFMGEVPFRHVYLHALVADEHGQKQSKSKGNAIDPVPTIQEYGADGFRFALIYSNVPNPYIALGQSQIESGRRFANKIWNVSRFLLMNLEGFDTSVPIGDNLPFCDRWIRSRYNHTVNYVTTAFEEYRFSDAAHALYEFLWHEVCDWYIEMIKQRLYYTDDLNAKHTAQTVAAQILEGTMRLLHPMMPFITEEIWQQLPHKGESIVVSDWPKPDPAWDDPESENAMKTIMSVIDSIRSIRGEMNVPPPSEIEVLIQAPDAEIRELLTNHLEAYLPAFTHFSRVFTAEHLKKPDAAAAAVIGDIVIYIPLAGLIDVEKEKARLQKRLDKVIKDLDSTRKTLNNPKFIDRAPESVVEQKRSRFEALESEKEKLTANLQMLG